MNKDMTNSEAIANLNHIYGFVSPDIQRSLDVAFKAMERPQGEWHWNEQGYFYCNKCNRQPRDQYAVTNFCPKCGADMRKPNCVTCDHFGNCEGCEKRNEE